MSFESSFSIVIDLSFYVLILSAAVYDILKFRIPNLIVVVLPLLFLLAAFFKAGDVAWLSHLGAGAIVLVCAALLFHFNLLGGGDAKLLASLSIWAGFDSLLPFLIAVSLMGGVLALVLMAVRPLFAKFDNVNWPLSVLPGNSLPYGVAIGGGAVAMRLMFPGF